MKVLHIVPALFSRTDGIIGGAERYAWELARFMARATDTQLVSFGEADATGEKDGLDYRVIGDPWFVRGQRSNPLAPELIPYLLQADVIHCHQQHVLTSTLAALVGRLARKRVFCSDLGGGGWDLSAYVSTDRLYHGHLHISQYSRRILGHEIHPAAHVIYGGVDLDKFSPAATPDSREPRVLFVGRLLAHKGVDYLIKAIEGPLELDVVGAPADPGYLAHLQELARGKAVRFHYSCDDSELVALYRRSLCCVLPSVYRDCYGNESRVPELLGQTPLEAQACGKPVVCTAVASLPEVCRDGETGFLVRPNDPDDLREKLMRLWQDDGLATSMGSRGREWVQESFSWQSVVDRCLEAYRGAD